MPFNNDKVQKLRDLQKTKSSLEKELIKNKLKSHEITGLDVPLNTYKPFGLK